ncbi:gamma-glutamyl-gamma-aminobutyrate hydrolase family protein [Varunaivibrio sulfuroxidans]|uniref:gamma-glutamyl-gamma-aminobutyrate hydrolase n=1 Tax=Varunaivibrio sulfuroxidans TaxID=1773489 RepID=A0A4R3JCM1_9PROT|nr:gamma-glutamyl-gamma-aminobutyrate hydrolase family protein [Varunaivibrio sulfuroxidans]TCS63417.1 gamma-glutamyl-gamma-aminobutyrate hydrolase [Varunaivibrio sulfuroxidans]WES30437.1 gamma-glutamyl-gamma-aminobutyrate hydrolase family protein [Varunaivibrio sulfuroxidans]
MRPRVKPVVGVSTCVKDVDGFANYAVAMKYVDALAHGGDVTPILIPALGEILAIDDILGLVDGLMLTGSMSNIEPHHYGAPPSVSGTLHDPLRDATTLPMIPAAVAAGLPVFAICRGFQELNVAYGGTLHQRVHEVAGKIDHREDRSLTPEGYFAPVHDIALAREGYLARLLGREKIRVNSLHGQGIDRLGDALTIEGVAPDGLIEAVSVTGAQTFALGVQWHPEWKVMENAISRALFAAFGDACRARLDSAAARWRSDGGGEHA